MNKIFYAVILFGAGCSSNKSVDTLHDYPMMGDDCPITAERVIENEEYLKAQAKRLNMRYVDYLHLITKKKMESQKALTTSNK
jgi:hypothetical protein